MKLREITEIANDTGVFAERGYNLKNFANRIIELYKQQRTWAGLTPKEEEEIITKAHSGAGWRFYIRETEAKLKEKNHA